MQLFNINLAFTKALKEKKYMSKVGLLLAVSLVLSILSAAINIFAANPKNDLLAALTAIFSCLTIIVSIVAGAITMWYSYEYTQAAMQQRETKALWEMDYLTSLKRIAKLFIVQFVYGLPFIILACCGLVVGLYSFLFAARTASGTPDASSALLLASGSLIAVLCLVLLFAIVVVVYQAYITLPATLKLIETNTIGEAFKVGRNMSHVKLNLGSYTKLLLVQLLMVVILGALSIVGAIPLIGSCLLIPVIVISSYVQTIAWSTLVGDFYRQVK